MLLCIHICCIPECKSNYVSSLKESNNKCETAFSFPKCSQRLMKWLNVIPRKNWTPSKTSVRNKKVPLAYPKLSENAIPRNFPNLPKYLPSDSPRIRADPEKRRENLLERDKKVLDDFLSEDMLSARELVVTLVIDEIYVTSRLDYKAQTVVGYAENESSKKDEDKDEFAKTKVAFMVCSASYGL
nr:unnamed protein product [Callosobruchus analis]